MTEGLMTRTVVERTALFLLMSIVPVSASAQVDTTTTQTMAQEGVYDRPFITSLGSTSIGGYVEGNTNYFQEDGVSEGFSMELRRFNIFLFSSISERIRFISELEFEHGTEEINIETALIDFQVSPQFVLRGGILLPPVGYFNQNHDSPKWEFIDRPLVSTEIIPSTLSEVGFGAFGKFFRNEWAFSYDFYATNGLGDGILQNDQGRTHIASGKREDQFEEDNNGSPALSARIGLQRRGWGEVGLSYYGAAYNSFEVEGEPVDEERDVRILAIDFGGEIGRVGVRGEFAFASIDVPSDLAELFGDGQWGGHVDIVAPVIRTSLLGYDGAVVNANLRIERIDFNTGTFSSTGRDIRDEITALVPGLSFRPTNDTVFRANYQWQWVRDFLGNPTINVGGFQFGFATYF